MGSTNDDVNNSNLPPTKTEHYHQAIDAAELLNRNISTITNTTALAPVNDDHQRFAHHQQLPKLTTISSSIETYPNQHVVVVGKKIYSSSSSSSSGGSSEDDGIDDGLPAKTIDNSSFHTFEDVLNMIKSDGRWQLCVMLTCLFTSVALQVSNYAQGIFFVGKLDHSCSHFENENTSLAVHHDATTSNNSTSFIANGNDDDVNTLACSSSAGARCRAWNYSSPYYGHTMQNEWNLVCEESYKIPLFQSSYLIGYMLGMPIFGAVADLYGRRIVILIAWPLLMASYIMTAIAPSYWLVATMRGLQGLLSGGDWKAKYVLTMEVTSIERRSFVSVMIGSCFPLAALVATALAWYIRDWRTLQLACVAPVLLILPLLFFIPESPRWLITHSRYDEAQKTLQRGAKFNGRKWPPNLDLKRLHDLHGHDDVSKKNASSKSNLNGKSSQSQNVPTAAAAAVLYTAKPKQTSYIQQTLTTAFSRFKSLLATSEMRKRSFILWIQWFVVELVFNGAMFYGTGVMPGNPYLVLVAMSIMRLLNNPLQIVLFNRIGVRNSHVILLMCAAISCGALGALPASWTAGVNALGIILLVSGNCFSDACEGALDIMTTEAFPTTLRQTGVGVCGMWAQVGAGISPFIAESLSVYWQPLPATIFASACLVAVVVIVLFSSAIEHAVLPDTLHDTELEVIKQREVAATGGGSSALEQQKQSDVVRQRRIKLKKVTAAPA